LRTGADADTIGAHGRAAMAGEAEIKALDKRVGGIERKLDELDKSLRAAGDFKALAARVTALEQICKVLMEARTESKATAAKMIADVAALNKQSVTPQTLDKLLDQQTKTAEAQAASLAKAGYDKARAEGEAMVRKSIEQHFKTMVESRLATVEKLVQAALAK
jgi:hypothetical protein